MMAQTTRSFVASWSSTVVDSRRHHRIIVATPTTTTIEEGCFSLFFITTTMTNNQPRREIVFEWRERERERERLLSSSTRERERTRERRRTCCRRVRKLQPAAGACSKSRDQLQSTDVRLFSLSFPSFLVSIILYEIMDGWMLFAKHSPSFSFHFCYALAISASTWRKSIFGPSVVSPTLFFPRLSTEFKFRKSGLL